MAVGTGVTNPAVNEKSNGLAEVLPTHTPALFQAAVDKAVAFLRAGEVVALPTETVYGLAANALNAAAVEKIFTLKGRPPENPVIVHVASLAMARKCADGFSVLAENMARAFWPGPLTMVLRRDRAIPDVVTAGGDTVGIRWPNHPLIQAVIRAADFPLAAPSANLSNQLSPTTAAHVRKSFGGRISLIIDGGSSQVGIESTVVDLTTDPPRVLRPGMIHEESLVAVTGRLLLGPGGDGEALKSPGLMKKHYSPRAKLTVLAWRDEPDLESKIRSLGFALESAHVIAHRHVPHAGRLGGVSVIPHDAAAFARALYAELHACDEAGAALIVVEELPKSSEWRGLRDRLTRASR